MRFAIHNDALMFAAYHWTNVHFIFHDYTHNVMSSPLDCKRLGLNAIVWSQLQLLPVVYALYKTWNKSIYKQPKGECFLQKQNGAKMNVLLDDS